jgi:hypothetical protein
VANDQGPPPTLGGTERIPFRQKNLEAFTEPWTHSPVPPKLWNSLTPDWPGEFKEPSTPPKEFLEIGGSAAPPPNLQLFAKAQFYCLSPPKPMLLPGSAAHDLQMP